MANQFTSRKVNARLLKSSCITPEVTAQAGRVSIRAVLWRPSRSKGKPYRPASPLAAALASAVGRSATAPASAIAGRA